ncbi:DUF2510 domain-containing protein [uncultured Jatrophihabitans sp.]|uniref:DUF2510 domain-containing protein n=1 Tax=uncultured Jatrophihabitans sp. TaxID=1610747 RepID=UPI0035CAE02A
MTDPNAQRADSVLDIRPTFVPLAFLLYFCTPHFSVNGSPPTAGRWKQNTVPVPAGRYEVTVWVKYLFRPQMGMSSVLVDVPPGGAAVITWRAPLTIFGSGAIAIREVVPLAAGHQGGPGAQSPHGGPGAQAHGSGTQQHGAGAAAPGWYQDPGGRHQLRYYDGQQWTEHVSTNNVQGRDPIAS